MKIIKWFDHFCAYFLKSIEFATKLPNMINIWSFSEIWPSSGWWEHLQLFDKMHGCHLLLFLKMYCLIIHKDECVQENWTRKVPGDVRVAALSKFQEYGLRFVWYLRQQGLNDRPHMFIVDSHRSNLFNFPFYQVMKVNRSNVHNTCYL